MKNKNRLEFDMYNIIKWSDEMIQGLDFLHNLTIIHGDIRPAFEFIFIKEKIDFNLLFF